MNPTKSLLGHLSLVVLYHSMKKDQPVTISEGDIRFRRKDGNRDKKREEKRDRNRILSKALKRSTGHIIGR